MTEDLKRRLRALEARGSADRPVRSMTDAELRAAVALGEYPTDEQLLEVLVRPATTAPPQAQKENPDADA